jgi:uncharacterized membrane protein
MRLKSKNKASALIVSLLVLSIIIISSLSLSIVSIRERNASMGESRSNLVFQAADTGIEEVMQDILKSGYTTVSQLRNCKSDGFIRNTDNTYYVELQDTSGAKIDCNGGTLISQIAAMKSVSNFSGESRAIMAAVVFP